MKTWLSKGKVFSFDAILSPNIPGLVTGISATTEQVLSSHHYMLSYRYHRYHTLYRQVTRTNENYEKLITVIMIAITKTIKIIRRKG